MPKSQRYVDTVKRHLGVGLIGMFALGSSGLMALASYELADKHYGRYLRGGEPPNIGNILEWIQLGIVWLAFFGFVACIALLVACLRLKHLVALLEKD